MAIPRASSQVLRWTTLGLSSPVTLTANRGCRGRWCWPPLPTQQGLTPAGKTAWTQSFESGEPVVGTPRSGTLGALQSGALEDSNVELSDQLVNLIVAQRNYQANAKTIETESAITQTIINLR